MPPQHHNDPPGGVADKVLRRAQVSKMTRALQDRLALANIKIQHSHGAHGRDSFPSALSCEPKRKRSDSNADLYSDTTSTTSGRCFSTTMSMSSPLSGPIFSDQLVRPSSSQGSFKISRKTKSFINPTVGQHRRKPRNSGTVLPSWKSSYRLAESSPIRPQRPPLQSMHHASFVSESSTVLNSPSASEDDDQDLPLHSFHFFSDPSNIPSSPPRTPSPDLSRSSQLRGKTFSPLSDPMYGGKEGADLLLHFASSPSPAVRLSNSSSQNPPSTPPSSRTPLPSSLMNTPGGQALWGFGATTPNAAFNFADFCNVTPSPAQRRWPSTPAVKTPHTARGRRDGLMLPPAASPNMMRTPARKATGLGMELGGELVRH